MLSIDSLLAKKAEFENLLKSLEDKYSYYNSINDRIAAADTLNAILDYCCYITEIDSKIIDIKYGFVLDEDED